MVVEDSAGGGGGVTVKIGPDLPNPLSFLDLTLEQAHPRTGHLVHFLRARAKVTSSHSPPSLLSSPRHLLAGMTGQAPRRQRVLDQLLGWERSAVLVLVFLLCS